MVYNDEVPYQINVNIVSRPAETSPHHEGVTLLCEGELSPVARKIEDILLSSGYRVDIYTPRQLPPTNQDVISLLDLSTPFLDGISSEKCADIYTRC